MESIQKVGQYLIHNADGIVREMMEFAIKNVEYEVTEEMIEQSVKINVEFMTLLANSFEVSKEKAAKELVDWSKKNGERQAELLA
ncbi:MAG TPA: hypothetical protein VLQ66_08590, partial [Paenisporosarcina sp.]|nr:hypothetical protein [Paenisporosarcina sp.]